jgi:hypothetical protein
MMGLYFGEELDKSHPSVDWTAESFFKVIVKGSTKTSAQTLVSHLFPKVWLCRHFCEILTPR